MTATHYRHTDGGGWFALVHDGRALLVEASAERALDLWPALIESADALLDRLTAGGLSAVPSFAFAEADAHGGLRTILRGPVAATVSSAGGGAERSGAGVATWREDADASATAVQLRRADAAAVPPDGLLPIVSGIVATDALALDVTASAPAPLPAPTVIPAAPVVAQPEPLQPEPLAPASIEPEEIEPVEIASEPVPASPAAESPAPLPAAEPLIIPAPAPIPAAQTPVEPSEDEVLDDAIDERTSVIPRRQPSEQALPEQTFLPEQTILPAAAEDSAADDEQDDLLDATIVSPSRAGSEPTAAEPAPTERFGVPAEGDHDGHTVMAEDLAELRARRREHGAAAPAAVPAPSLHLLRFDGVVEALDQPVLVGRAPSVSQVPGGRIPRLVTVTSLGQDISRNHVQFAVEGGTVVVTDLHSRNGTHVILPGKSPQKLRQGEPTAVIVGTVIDLGGGVVFTVSED